MVKLKDGEIKWIVKHVENGSITTRQAADIYGVTIRRVQQLVKEYREKNIIHRQKKNRRPKTYLTEEQKNIIDKVWREMKVGARLLYYEIRRRGYKIPHNKIHSYLKETGRTIPNPKKQKKRKRCRYERKYSGNLIHGDWHRKSIEHPYVIMLMMPLVTSLLEESLRKQLLNIQSKHSKMHKEKLGNLMQKYKKLIQIEGCNFILMEKSLLNLKNI